VIALAASGVKVDLLNPPYRATWLRSESSASVDGSCDVRTSSCIIIFGQASEVVADLGRVGMRLLSFRGTVRLAARVLSGNMHVVAEGKKLVSQLS